MTTTIHWRSGNSTDVFTPRAEGETIVSLTQRHSDEVQWVHDHPPNGETPQ